MNIEIIGDYFFDRLYDEGGIIYQDNYKRPTEIVFTCFAADYTDPNNIFNGRETIARFIVKPKNPLLK